MRNTNDKTNTSSQICFKYIIYTGGWYLHLSLPIQPQRVRLYLGQTGGNKVHSAVPAEMSEVQCPAWWREWRVEAEAHSLHSLLTSCLPACRHSKSPADAVCSAAIGTVSASLTRPDSHQALCSFIHHLECMSIDTEYGVEIFLSILFSYSK